MKSASNLTNAFPFIHSSGAFMESESPSEEIQMLLKNSD